jgi:hypothetical protein
MPAVEKDDRPINHRQPHSNVLIRPRQGMLPLSLPFPDDPKLAARCRRFIENPTAQDTIDVWRRELGLSRRTFRLETGLTFSVWRRRACLLAALP